MRRSILVVMLDVMVLSVLSLSLGRGSSGFVLPVYRWSQIVAEGLEKEQAYRELVEDMQTRLAAAQAESVAAAEAAREAAIQRRIAEEAAARVEARGSEAEARALDAQVRAEVAAQKAREAEERMAAARREEQAIRARTGEIESRSREAELRASVLEDAVEQALAAQDQLLARERAVIEQLAAAREAQAMAEGRAAQAAEEKQRAERSAENAREYIAFIRRQMVEVESRERETRFELARVEEQKVEAEQTLEALAEEQRQSVWVRREDAIRRLRVFLGEQSSYSRGRRIETMFLPVVQMGAQFVLPTEFDSLGLGWREVQQGGQIVAVDLDIEAFDEEGPVLRVSDPIVAPTESPRICLVVLPAADEPPPALMPLGMEALKAERLQSALLFKKEFPDQRMAVVITPALDGNFISVRPQTPTPLVDLRARQRPRAGDYLLTENGRFLGVMISSDRAYVLPVAWPDIERQVRIPVEPPNENGVYERFVVGSRLVRDMIRKAGQ